MGFKQKIPKLAISYIWLKYNKYLLWNYLITDNNNNNKMSCNSINNEIDSFNLLVPEINLINSSLNINDGVIITGLYSSIFL